jgi:riboflavin synthase
MFTGIVEEIGTVRSIDRRSGYQRTTIGASTVLEGLKVGDSVSLAGACHTAVDIATSSFTVESVEETLKRTTMGELGVGERLNLERSVRLADRLDGHLVQGHVDGVGRVVIRDESSDHWDFTIEMSTSLSRYVAEKGSIAIDGISLTVVSVGADRFSVTIIPHTMKMTTMGDRRQGDPVNLEVDLVARYLERLVGAGTEVEGLTAATLQRMGFSA